MKKSIEKVPVKVAALTSTREKITTFSIAQKSDKVKPPGTTLRAMGFAEKVKLLNREDAEKLLLFIKALDGKNTQNLMIFDPTFRATIKNINKIKEHL